jgi:hypothetical protein
MSNAQETKQALIDHRVITDVLPGNLDLSYDLTIKWPNATLEKPGEEMGREDTQSVPSLYLHPTVCQTNLVYLITLVFHVLIESRVQPSEPLDNLVLIMSDPVTRNITMATFSELTRKM